MRRQRQGLVFAACSSAPCTLLYPHGPPSGNRYTGHSTPRSGESVDPDLEPQSRLRNVNRFQRKLLVHSKRTERQRRNQEKTCQDVGRPLFMWRYEFGPNLRGRLAQGWATDQARPSGDGLRLSAEDARGGLSARRLSRFPCGRAFVRTGALRTETKKRSAGPAPAARLESWRWRVQRAARMATSRAAPR